MRREGLWSIRIAGKRFERKRIFGRFGLIKLLSYHPARALRGLLLAVALTAFVLVTAAAVVAAWVTLFETLERWAS